MWGSWQIWGMLGGWGAPCFRLRGAEDNFIFYIEYCFLFVQVMKLRWEYNILKHFGSISCEMFDYGHIFPQKTLWFGEKMAFLSQKSWFHAISWLFSFPTILICKIWTKYNFTATAEFRRTRFSCSNTPKHAQNWLFLGVFSFFLFLRSLFLGTLSPKYAFSFIKCGIKYPKWLIYATSIHKTELSNLTKNEIVLRPKHGAPPLSPNLDNFFERQKRRFKWHLKWLIIQNSS